MEFKDYFTKFILTNKKMYQFSTQFKIKNKIPALKKKEKIRN